MKAFVCDRCGKTFTMAEYSVIEKEFPCSYHAIDFGFVDMCPACCAAFEKWWKQYNTSVE